MKSEHRDSKTQRFPSIGNGLFWVILIIIFPASSLVAQLHLSPPHGENGVPGIVPKSFVMEWQAIEGAIGYEYVLSDNPLCFAGCSGDTRQRAVTTTSTTEYNLQTDIWYYWITRIIYSHGDTSEWSFISSFFAATPDFPSGIVNISPNPATDDQIRLTLDWGIDPEAQLIVVNLFNTFGQKQGEWNFMRPGNGIRFEVVEMGKGELMQGVYILQASILGASGFNPNNLSTQKLILR